jgi:hypothetical protein
MIVTGNGKYEARVHVKNGHFRIVERTHYIAAGGAIDHAAIAAAKKLARS